MNDEKSGAPANGDHSTQFLANERTFLAWLKTCIAVLGLGFVVARFGSVSLPLSSDDSFFDTGENSGQNGKPLKEGHGALN